MRNNQKHWIILSIAVIVSLVAAFILPTMAEEPQGKHNTVPEGRYAATRIVSIIESYHYLKPQINDDVAQQLFDEYIKKLDPNKFYFTAGDIQQFAETKMQLDDLLKQGNTDFAFVVYKRFLERLEQRLSYLKKRISESFDFSKDESFTIKREKVSWAQNTEELDEIWRKHIKNQLLQAKLQDLQQEKEDAKEQSNDSKTQDLNIKKSDKEDPDMKTPDIKESDIKNPATEVKKEEEKKSQNDWEESTEERIVKRYENYYKFMNGNDGYYILEQYLTSLTSLFDPHSSYFNWRSLDNFNISLKLSLQGIGAVISSENGYPKISSVVPGGPADKQGELKAGYYIVAVIQESGEQKSVIDMPLNQVVQKIRGEKGTKVTLKVLKNRKGVPFNITITRDEVKLEERAAKGETKEITSEDGSKSKVGIISLPSFYRDFKGFEEEDPNARSTTKDVKKIIEGMKKENVSGLVIDLRSNGGGSLEEVVDLVGLFIPKGPVVQIKDLEGKIEVRNDRDNGFAYTMPLIVITNTFSASASEIFAGAIQDYKRGIVVGSNTYGKGTVQSFFAIAQNRRYGALKYTTSKFYRPTGASTQKKGVSPDIPYPSLIDHEKYGETSLPHVMPWDTIPPQELQLGIDAHKHLDAIRKNFKERTEKNPKFQTLRKYIAKIRERQDEKAVSLNLQKRKEMQEEESSWYKEVEEILGENTDENKEDDFQLEESIKVLEDLIKAG